MERFADTDVGIHGRAAELARIGRFLDDVASHPAALLIEGEAGIGKTTLWSAGIDQARHRGWQVLTCRPVQAEAALSFSALGDLLEPEGVNITRIAQGLPAGSGLETADEVTLARAFNGRTAFQR